MPERGTLSRPGLQASPFYWRQVVESSSMTLLQAVRELEGSEVADRLEAHLHRTLGFSPAQE